MGGEDPGSSRHVGEVRGRGRYVNGVLSTSLIPTGRPSGPGFPLRLHYSTHTTKEEGVKGYFIR